MKNKVFLFLLLSLSFCVNLISYAAKITPDPLYLNSDVLDVADIEIKEKEVDPRTIEEKIRAKLHLKPSKKIYYHNIDKSNQPITMEDYNKIAADKKRKSFVIPEPEFVQEDDFILPDPKFRVIRYNTPPGQRNIDVSKIVENRTVSAPGILSPDKSKMVYTKCFFYPKLAQTSSAAYLININSKYTDAYDALFMTNVMEGDTKPILTVGMDEIQLRQFKTLYPIDWSKDSSKIAFKEKVGSNLAETWQTNIIVYDFKTKSFKKLTAVREAIIYYWRQHKQIELKDYMWDIFPVGWDKNNPDRMVVYAYAFTSSRPFFLGTWSIDYKGEKSELLSIDSTNVEIDLNGFGLKEVKFEN